MADDDRPQLGPSDALLSAPLHNYTASGPVADEVLTGWRPQISGSPDAVTGAPLSPPPDGAREGGGLQLGSDPQGGYAVPRELDGHNRRPPRRRP